MPYVITTELHDDLIKFFSQLEESAPNKEAKDFSKKISKDLKNSPIWRKGQLFSD